MSNCNFRRLIPPRPGFDRFKSDHRSSEQRLKEKDRFSFEPLIRKTGVKHGKEES
jgi:hypothetical protein